MKKDEQDSMFTIVDEDVIGEYPYYIEPLDQTLDVSVKYIDEDTLAAMQKSTKGIVFVSHNKKSGTDMKKFNKMLLDKALVGIENLTWRALKYLIEPNKKIILEGAKWEDPVTFNGQIKNLIIENINFSFFAFIQEKCRDTEAIVKAQEEAEKENLAPSSGTSEAHS